ncbi:MAG: helix-turn-helix domain-containing protein [Ruminococcus sp.]|nr:helix-turn-helix domain-containing protein [Ruminococcus sp.]
MMSVQEVADVLGISKSSAYVLSKEKGFPTLKIGSRVVIPRDRFIEWIKINTKSRRSDERAVESCHSQRKTETISFCRTIFSIWICPRLRSQSTLS